MADPADRLLTYDDLLAATTGGPTPEIIDGRLTRKASPRGAHGRAQRRLGSELDPLDRPADDGGGWWLLIEPDVRFTAHTVLRPDLAGWRRERLPKLPAGVLDVRPDWVCEVLSPGHENHDRITKMSVYATHGVPWAWLLHPEERRLEVHSLHEGRWLLRGALTDGAVERIPPFQEVLLDVGGLFLPREDVPPVAGEAEIAYRAW